MPWPISNRIDYTFDRPAPRQRVKDLESRDNELIPRPWRYNFAQVSTTSTTPWQLAHSKRVYAPGLFPSVDLQVPGNDPEQYTLTLEIFVDAWVSVGGGGLVRLRRDDPTFPLDGLPLSIVATSPTKVSLVLKGIDFIGFPQDIWLQYYATAGTIFLRSGDPLNDWARGRFILEET